jgi:serine/threonine-protein kinase
MGLFGRWKSFLDSGQLDVNERFELLRKGTSGTMSDFHVARDRETGQLVGLKILDPEKTALFEARFKGLKKPTEGEIGMAIVHPRVVKTLRHGTTTDGRQYVLMEYLSGPGLNMLINDQSPLLKGNRVALMRDMAEGVQAVHAAGFIHRDICPRNFICLADATSLKLIDFGLTLPATPEFMQPGNRTGTPTYMAPEIARRRATDHRVDLFSLGVSYYQLCAGVLPWPSGDTTGRVAMLHDTMAPTPLVQHCPQLDPRVAELVHKCLEVEPSRRPASAQQIAETLGRLLKDGQLVRI